MRYLLFCLACLPATALAQQAPNTVDPQKFELRFRAADMNGDGRLSREEARAAFPNAMKFFAEIDVDNDNYITLVEIQEARARRIEAAVNASSMGAAARYVKPDYLRGGNAWAGGEVDTSDLSSSIAQVRATEFNEFLGDDASATAVRNLAPPPKNSNSNLFNKSFW